MKIPLQGRCSDSTMTWLNTSVVCREPTPRQTNDKQEFQSPFSFHLNRNGCQSWKENCMALNETLLLGALQLGDCWVFPGSQTGWRWWKTTCTDQKISCCEYCCCSCWPQQCFISTMNWAAIRVNCSVFSTAKTVCCFQQIPYLHWHDLELVKVGPSTQRSVYSI